MTYIHSQRVHWYYLSDKQISWLLENDDCFVLITDGDSSMQYNFDEIPLTFEKVLGICSPNEEIVLCQMPEKIPDGFRLSKAYCGDLMLVKNSD